MDFMKSLLIGTLIYRIIRGHEGPTQGPGHHVMNQHADTRQAHSMSL